MKKTELSSWQKAFGQGYACAVANMMRDYDQPTIAEHCLAANFSTLQDLKNAEVYSADIEILKPIVREIERKARLNNKKILNK